jgi:enolase
MTYPAGREKETRMSAKIKQVKAREIFDGKGLPNIEVDVTLGDGSLGRAPTSRPTSGTAI